MHASILELVGMVGHTDGQILRVKIHGRMEAQTVRRNSLVTDRQTLIVRFFFLLISRHTERERDFKSVPVDLIFWRKRV